MCRLAPLALILALAACQAPASDSSDAGDPAGPVDADAVETAIRAMSDAYEAAARAGDEAALFAMHADDAVLHPAGRPAARGRAAVDSLLAADNGEPSELELTTTEVVVSEAGDLAYEIGTIGGSGAAGKYLTVYRNTADGWRIVADTWSSDAPATDASSVDTTDGG